MFSSNNSLMPTIKQKVLSNKEIAKIKKESLTRLWIICLGISVGELFALDYSDIDFENKTIKIDKILYNGSVLKHRKAYRIRTLKLPTILFENLSKKDSGRIFEEEKIEDYETLLNTHVKLLLAQNVTINVIYKNIAMHNIVDFEIRFGFLLPQQLSDDFEIL